MNKSIRIVVPTYNSQRSIAGCLDAIYASSYKDFEVVVVDDGSADRTVEIVAKYPCRLIKFDANRGAACARNAGTADSGKDYFLFIDSDVMIEKDTLRKLIERARSEKVEAVIGCYTKLPLSPCLFSIYHNLFQYFYFFRNTSLHSDKSGANIFWTGCGLVEAAAFNDVGGFCENVEGASTEDGIFGYELRKKGYRIYVDMDIAVPHDHRYSFLQLTRNYFRRATNLSQTMFISRPDKQLNQGYLNLFNIGSLALSCLFAFASLGSIVSGRILGMALFTFALFVLINLNFYIFILRATTIQFAVLAIMVNLFFYLTIGLGLAIGLISGFISRYAGDRQLVIKK